MTKATLGDAIAANNNGGDPETVAILLGHVQANMAIEGMHRDRMLFLDLTSDPNFSSTEKDFANNILRNDFQLGVQNKRGSARSNKVFAAYQLQFLKETQFASAKATANHQLATSTESASCSGSSGSNNDN